jgi:hypothetical protein
MQTNNPLTQFFRQPAIYLRLPSNGKFWPENSLVMPPNNELPVLPMTARDEISYRTPDALFNGSAAVSVIQSCVPNIKDAWQTPSCDFTAILIAIRIASYGHQYDVDTKCPKCNHEASYGLDLRRVLDGISSINFDQPLSLGDLEIHFRPMTYHVLNQANILNFENQRDLQAISNEKSDDETKSKKIAELIKKITDASFDAVAANISSIKTPNVIVTEKQFIAEFLANCDRKLYEKIKDVAIESKTANDLNPLEITCQNCNHEYKQEFVMDMTSFFEVAS